MGWTFREWGIAVAWYRRAIAQIELASLDDFLEVQSAWLERYAHRPGEVQSLGVEHEVARDVRSKIAAIASEIAKARSSGADIRRCP
jgi:hypothetical protein